MNLLAPIGAMVEGYVFALSHAPRSWLVFDVGGDVGFFPSSRSFATFIGMTVVPAVLWRTGPTDATHASVGPRVRAW